MNQWRTSLTRRQACAAVSQQLQVQQCQIIPKITLSPVLSGHRNDGTQVMDYMKSMDILWAFYARFTAVAH